MRWQVITGGMRPLFVVRSTPDLADVVLMLFRHDHELVQIFEFQSLVEPDRVPYWKPPSSRHAWLPFPGSSGRKFGN